jgi:hypothetical protein
LRKSLLKEYRIDGDGQEMNGSSSSSSAGGGKQKRSKGGVQGKGDAGGRYIVDEIKAEAVKAAQALLSHGDKMPLARKEKLLGAVQRWRRQRGGEVAGVSEGAEGAGVEEGAEGAGAQEGVVRTEEDLSAVAGMEWRTLRADFVCDDQRLVEAVMGHGSFKSAGNEPATTAAAESEQEATMQAINSSLQGFVMRWRRLLLDSMRPRHMPVGWDVGHRLQDWQHPPRGQVKHPTPATPE